MLLSGRAGHERKTKVFDQYKALGDLIGADWADEFMWIVFKELPAWINPPPKSLEEFYATATSDYWLGFYSDFLDKELKNVRGRQALVDDLLDKARKKALVLDPANEIRPENEFYTPTAGITGERDIAVDKAAQWIIGDYGLLRDGTVDPSKNPSRADWLKTYRKVIAKYVAAGGQGTRGVVGTADKIREMHHELTLIEKEASRMQYFLNDAGYPTTAGGGYLLKRLYADARQVPLPEFGGRHWDNLAMFYLSAFIAIQAFQDANKRGGHAVYAILLIKGTNDFFAPTVKRENELNGMR